MISLKGTILAGNMATGTSPECDAITSQGHNLIGDPTGCTISGQQATDITGQNPFLGPLGDNGGPTQTHALLKGSPAIDAGPPDAPPTDQRGAPRNPDIGAYELVLCQKVVVNRVGTSALDVLVGTAGRDGFLGFRGNDTLRGKAGKDALCGGPGKDRLKGGGGNDRLDGGPGKDLCAGQAGRKDRARKCETEKSIP